MILLLLTSALALSFVPLKSNTLTAITVEVGTVTYDAGTKKLTIPLTASGALDSETNTFELAIFESEDGDEEIGTRVNVKTLLTDTSEQNAEFTFDFATIKADLAAVHIDVIETDKDDDTSTRSMLTARKEVAFRTVSAVAFAEDTDPTKVKITVTVDDEVTGATLEFLGESLETTSTVAKEYSAVIEKAKILAAESLVGYFKGTNLATSSLPFTILIAKPVPPTDFKLLSATHAQFTYTPTAGAKLMILPTGGAEKEITQPQGETYYTVAYADISVEYKLYYAKAAGAPMSAALVRTALPATVGPTAKDLVVVTGADKVPSLKLTFATGVTNRQLVVVDDELAVNSVALAEQTLTADKLVGSAAFFIVADSATKVVASLPLALAKAVFAQTPAAAAGGKIPVTVEMTAGFYEAEPKGLFVHERDPVAATTAQYYALTWSDTAATASKAVADVTVADWTEQTDKNILSFVAGDYVAGPPKTATKLSTAAVVIVNEPELPVITVGPATFAPATLKLTIPVESDTDLTAAPYTIRLAGYTADADGTELFTKDVKALLDGEESHTVEFTLDMGEKFVGLKTIHIDVLAQSEGEEEVSILSNEERVPVNFAAMKVTVAHASTDTDVTFTFTLDADLEAGLANTKFVFNGVEETVTKESSPAYTYAVTITKAKLKAAPTTLGYFKGSNLATSTLPIWLFESAPQFDVEHVDATTFKATPKAGTVPEGSDVWMKVGTAAAAKQTKVADKEYYLFNYEDMVDAVIYTADAAEIPTSNKPTITIPAFTAPEYEWVLVTEGADKTPKVKLVFEGANAKRKLIVPGTPDTVISLDTAEKTFDLADLVKTGAYYIVYDAEKAPETRPLAISAATLVQAKGTEKDGKVPVTVTVEAGLLTAVPTGILVHAEGETVADKMKYYALTWGTTAETVNKATAQVTVADFAELTAKNIESYVANKVGDAAPTKIAAAEKIVVIPKKEDPGKDEGAFGKMVSLMAVVVSLFVLAL